jgi:hypothetical protein
MLYLIGGPPRCGKTTLGGALAKKHQIPYFSIDHITSVIPPYISAERQDESFPLRALRQQVNNDNDRFFERFSSDEIVSVYLRVGSFLDLMYAKARRSGFRAVSTRCP